MRVKIVLFLLLLLNGNLFCIFEFGRNVYQVKTKYFDILFGENSQDLALRIATYADDIYTNMIKKFNSTYNERLTVIISGDVDEANGYATTAPTYTTITIFDVPPPIESTVGNNYNFFKNEFLHELMHTISIHHKGDFIKLLNSIFGNWISPHLAMPMYMIEGVTVSYESHDGYGRVNDPFIQQQIKQDILENNFKSLPQSTGAYDSYPSRKIFYHYGGLFSYYLQKKYGIEKYSELWLEMGKNIFSGLSGSLFMYGTIYDLSFINGFLGETFGINWAFKTVYGVSIEEEWENFKNEISYKGTVFTNEKLLIDEKANIDSPIIVNNKIYYIDHFNESINSIDLNTLKKEIIYEAEEIQSIDVSPDDKYMLINRNYTANRRNSITKSVVQLYDLVNKKFLDFKLDSLKEVSFFNDGYIGIRAKNHYSDIVYINKNGEITDVLLGSDTRFFSKPKKLNDNEIVFLVSEKGKITIGKYNFNTKIFSILNSPINFIRNISVYEDKILFSYNNDYTFHKIGIIKDQKIIIQTNNYFGGAFFPMANNKTIYYLASFSDGLQFMIYPEDIDNFNGEELKLEYKELNKITYDERKPNFEGEIESYNPISYMLPKAWIPIIGFKGTSEIITPENILSFTFDAYTNISSGNFNNWISNKTSNLFDLDRIGILLMIRDPFGLNSLTIMPTYSIFNNFLNLTIDWDNTSLPIYYKINFSDKVNYHYPNSIYFRQLSLYLDTGYVYNFYGMNNYLKLGFIGQYNKILLDQYIVGESPSPANTAYIWAYLYSENVIISPTIKFANYTMFSPYKTYDNRGFELTGSIEYNFDISNNFNFILKNTDYKFDFTYYPYIIPMQIKLNTIISPNTNASLGAYYEYATSTNRMQNGIIIKDLKSTYIFSGEINYLLFNIEIQNGLTFLPIYFNRLYCVIGYRGAYIENDYFHSVFGRLYLTIPYLTGQLSQIKINCFAEGNYAFYTANLNWRVGIDIGKQFEKD